MAQRCVAGSGGGDSRPASASGDHSRIPLGSIHADSFTLGKHISDKPSAKALNPLE
jgi:hypothetical protein